MASDLENYLDSLGGGKGRKMPILTLHSARSGGRKNKRQFELLCLRVLPMWEEGLSRGESEGAEKSSER